MSAELCIDEESLCSRRIESMRLEIKQSLSSDTVHTTRVSTDDIIGRYLEYRHPSDLSADSEKYIILIDSRLCMTIRCIDDGTPSYVETSMVTSDTEYLQM